MEYLLGLDFESADSRTRGALRRRASAGAVLRDPSTYVSLDRYRRAVGDLDWALRAASAGSGSAASLADYRDSRLSPLRRADLIESARDFESSVFFPLFEKLVGPELRTLEDGLVGVSICFLSQALCGFALAGYVKARLPEARVILGGGLISSWMAGGTLRGAQAFEGVVDELSPGPGEYSMTRMPGSEGKVASLTALTVPPDFDDFSHIRYFSPKRILPYNFSYGCPWKRCSFCPERAEDSPYRGIAVPTALAQLAFLSERYAPSLFHFTDNEISPAYLGALTKTRLGVPWYGFARFSRRLLEPGFCESLADSGCAMLQLGLESGDQDVLDAMAKGTRIDEISEALGLLSKASIGVYLYVLFGTPAEDRAAAMRTRDFIVRNSSAIRFLNVAVFNLPAASPDARSLRTRSFYDGDLSLYREFRHPSGWDRRAIRDFLVRDFEAHPDIRAILRRTPPIFTSSHAPFFLQATEGREGEVPAPV